MRRGGFTSRSDAQTALGRVLACERAGIRLDDRQTVADYLTTWLADKALVLKPTTMANYTAYLGNDLIPALGAIRLEKLSHTHITEFIHRQLAAGRRPTTLRRCIATLSSALGDAVRQRRLTHNAAQYATTPRPPKPERPCWTPAQACTFLRYCAAINDPLTELFEVLIGTGLRKGEALGLHWADVDLNQRVLFVRYTLSNINNTTPIFTAPKTKTSLAWVGLSTRVFAALHRQAARQHRQRLHTTTRYHDLGLVFCRANGQPLRPEYVLHRFHQLTAQAGLPRIRVHDLRHLAATLMIGSNVPLAMASKTLRHSTLSTTVNIYGHLTPQAAHQAVDAITTALNAADTSTTAA
jgi:integrase